MPAFNSSTPTIRELADQFCLHRSGRRWRGACPACGYADAFVLADGRIGPIGWCASCCDKDAIARVLRSPHRAATPRPQEEKDARDAQARLGRAERLWAACVALPGTTAATYLRARGVDHLGTCLEFRFHPNCPHPTGTTERPVRLPALIAAVRNVDGKFIGVHRTYLRTDGTGKADIEPPKASLGPVRGGAVRLAPIEHVLTAGELVVGEGIETSAAAGLLLSFPAWAAISAGNLARGVVLPPDVRRVVIAADPDPAGRDAAHAAWFRLRAEGRRVEIATPNQDNCDFNDLLLQRCTA
jgi:hypothetical protein